MTSSDTRSSILNVAQRLVLIRGFDDFSHAEIRAEGSVHTSTIYYYFSTSGDLGREMFVRYFKINLRLTYMTQRLNDQKKPNPGSASTITFRGVLLDGADLWVYPTDGSYFIGGNLYNKVRDFVAGNITWLEGALIAANATECFAFTSSAQLTKAVLSLVQDAGLVVRCSSDPALDDDNVSIFLRMTQAPAPAPIDSLSTNQWNDVDLQGATYAARCRRQSWFMHAQIIAYCLKSISEANYRDQTVKPDAQILAAVPGPHSKVWLSNPQANTYGRFYLGNDRSPMETFMASDIIKAVVARPFLEGVHSEDYAVPGDASRVTRWLSAAS